MIQASPPSCAQLVTPSCTAQLYGYQFLTGHLTCAESTCRSETRVSGTLAALQAPDSDDGEYDQPSFQCASAETMHYSDQCTSDEQRLIHALPRRSGQETAAASPSHSSESCVSNGRRVASNPARAALLIRCFTRPQQCRHLRHPRAIRCHFTLDWSTVIRCSIHCRCRDTQLRRISAGRHLHHLVWTARLGLFWSLQGEASCVQKVVSPCALSLESFS